MTCRPAEAMAGFSDAVVADRSLTFHVGGTALFGPAHDIVVRRVGSSGAVQAHIALADHLRDLPGFAADEPAHWRRGYQPHITLGPAVVVDEGDTLRATRVGLARIDGTFAEIVGVVDIG